MYRPPTSFAKKKLADRGKTSASPRGSPCSWCVCADFVARFFFHWCRIFRTFPETAVNASLLLPVTAKQPAVMPNAANSWINHGLFLLLDLQQMKPFWLVTSAQVYQSVAIDCFLFVCSECLNKLDTVVLSERWNIIQKDNKKDWHVSVVFWRRVWGAIAGGREIET